MSSTRSDLGARILAALPAIAFALFIVIEGGPVFMVGVFALGVLCMHELYGMFDRAHPVRLAGYLTLAGLLAAAQYS
jgi:phosphatidate cytidylyltransferase